MQLYIKCPNCDKMTEVPWLFADSYECGMCGTHGEVKISGSCEHCDKHFEGEAYSW